MGDDDERSAKEIVEEFLADREIPETSCADWQGSAMVVEVTASNRLHEAKLRYEATKEGTPEWAEAQVAYFKASEAHREAVRRRNAGKP